MMITDPREGNPGGTETVKASFLANRQFLLLAAGQAITNTTVTFYTTLLLVWLFVLTGSGTATSGVLVATILPGCLLGPVAGVFVDRWSRKRTLLATTGALALATLPPLLAAASWRIPAIYGSALLVSACACFFMPAKAGLLQTVVPEHHQTQSSYWSAALFTLGYVAGVALAAPLYFTLGPLRSILLAVALFLLSTSCLALLRPDVAAARAGSGEPAQSAAQGIRAVGRELLDGIRFISRTRALAFLLLSTCLVFAGSNIFNALNIVFVTHRLQVSTQFIGPVNVSISIGTLFGSLLAGLLIKRADPKYLFAGGILLVGIGLTGYAFTTWYSLGVVLVGAAVLPQGGVDVGLGPILNNNTPNTLIGRVQAVIETSNQAAGLLAVSLAGVFVQLFPIHFIFAGIGLLVVLASAVAALGLTRQAVSTSRQAPLPNY